MTSASVPIPNRQHHQPESQARIILVENELHPFVTRHRRTLVTAILAAGSSVYADSTLTTGQNVIDTTGKPVLAFISRVAWATRFENTGIERPASLCYCLRAAGQMPRFL
jgi:hypothetical protein